MKMKATLAWMCAMLMAGALAQDGAWVVRPLPEDTADSFFFGLSLPTDREGWLVGFETVPGEAADIPEGEIVVFEGEFPFDTQKGAEGEGEGEDEGEAFFDKQPLDTLGMALKLNEGVWGRAVRPEVSGRWSLYGVDVAPDGTAWIAGKDYAISLNLVVDTGSEGEGEGEGEGYAEVTGNMNLAVAVTGGADPAAIEGPGTAPLLVAEAVSATEAWFAGAGSVTHYVDGVWEDLPLAPLELILDLARIDTANLLVAGQASGEVGAVARWTGGMWVLETLPEIATAWRLHAMAVHSPQDVYAAGYVLKEDGLNYRGIMVHFDGVEWVEETLPGVAENWYLVDVAAVSAETAWAIGKDVASSQGFILRRDAGGWAMAALPSVSADFSLNAVAFPGPLDGMAIGYDEANARPLLLRYYGGRHAADVDANYGITLTELLRVIQFYNSDGYSCDATGEDGYRPGPGERQCAYHDSDYAPGDWHINLIELLRIIQFYNVGGYSLCPEDGTEDNFCPGLEERARRLK